MSEPGTVVVITLKDVYNDVRAMSASLDKVLTLLTSNEATIADHAATIADHETRIRDLEQKVWKAAGAGALVSGALSGLVALIVK